MVASSIAANTKVDRPAHVAPELVVDFNCYTAGDEGNVHEAWMALRDKGRVVWTPYNGGHWIVTRAEDIKMVQSDHEYFSAAQINVPPYPEDGPKLMPLQADPPVHGRFRALISKPFMPAALARLEQAARDVAKTQVAKLAPQGGTEFIGGFATVLPITVFLNMVDLPLAHRDKLLVMADGVVRGGGGEVRDRAFSDLSAYLIEQLELRARSPGDDLLSTITSATIRGDKITRTDALHVALTLLLGGLDTVASLLGFFALHLATHDEDRALLRNDPAAIDPAIEELIRRYGVINTGRIVAKDIYIGSATLKAGEMVQAPSSLYGLDEALTPDPLTVDLKRVKPQHVAFGSGVHICPGQLLARRELRVFIEEWLRFIPDFSIKRETSPKFASGIVNAITELYLEWPSALENGA